MADREVTVSTKIDATVSTGQAAPVLAKLRREIEELQKFAASPPAGMEGAWEKAVQGAVAARQRAQVEMARGVAEARATGFIPARDVAAVGDEEDGGGGGVRARTRRLRVGIDIAQGGPTAALGAAVGLAGPVGLVAAGLLAVGSVATSVVSAFVHVRDSAETLVAVQRQQAEDLRQARQTGTVSPEALRRALTPAEQTEYAQAEERGDEVTQRRIVGRARQRAQQEATAAGPGAGGRVGQLEADMRAFNQSLRNEPGGFLSFFANVGRGIASPFMDSTFRQRWFAMFRRAGVPENQIPEPPTGPLTPQQIEQYSAMAGSRSVGAQANVATTTNALQPGGLPSLAPGGLSLRDLPGLFQSRQTDVLQVHEEVQREMVRDQREEQRFQQQYEIWVRILARLEAGGASGGPWWGPASWGAAS